MRESGDRALAPGAARRRGACAPAPRGAPGRHLAWILAALVLQIACGPDEPAGRGSPAESDVVVAEADDEAPGEAPQELAFRRALLVPDSVFPHGEHRTLRCSTCHEEVPTHLTHQDVECTACHERPEDYGTRPVRSRDECLACHHQQVAEVGCGRCHEGGGPSHLTVGTTLGVAGRRISREVAFDHDWHAGVDCRQCHEAGVTFRVERSCASCHEEHHEPDAPCLSCHEDGLDRHDAASHLGCSGAGCHTDPVVLALPGNRTLCLSCHSATVDHMPNRDCAECHRVAPSETAPVGVGGA